ncbi:High-affinity glucose transporter [Cyberlindnera fabianii]|uniref:High-affinity glucose transporter n=1 Tax=Cyberlindnera fabianii TaxID=36022 RepID=A0A1V2L9F3_CYBFA|nr:High-affinity glucose transporter [Cyberlindnera fabianii]
MSFFSWDIWVLIAGRSVKGVSVGIFSAMLSVYLLEVTPALMRGLATSTVQWSLTWGIMIMFYVSFFCNMMDDDWSFRTAWAIEGVPGLILFVASFSLPESPKWLASQGRLKESTEISGKLISAQHTNVATTVVTLSTESKAEGATNSASIRSLSNQRINSGNDGNRSQTCTYGELLQPGLRKHLLAGVLTQAVVQLSGIGVLMYYLVFICEMIGLQGQTKIVCASIQYVVNVLFTIIPIFIIEKMRRKDVLVFGASSLSACIGAVGVVMGMYGHEVPPVGGNESVVWEVTGTPGSLTLALCFLFVAIFAATLSCAAWLYTNEIFPVRAKAKGSSICMAVSWTCNFILTFLAPLSLSRLKWGTFVLFGCLGLIGAFVIGLWFPETYGKTDEEIVSIFRESLIGVSDEERQDDGVGSEKRIETSSMKSGRHSGHLSIYREDSPVRSSLKVLNEDHTPNNPTLKLAMTGNLRLAPPSSGISSATSSTQVQPVNIGRSPSRTMSQRQSSPFLKKIGAPVDDDAELLSEPASASTFSRAPTDDKAKTPDGYYNVSDGGSPLLNGYV